MDVAIAAPMLGLGYLYNAGSRPLSYPPGRMGDRYLLWPGGIRLPVAGGRAAARSRHAGLE